MGWRGLSFNVSVEGGGGSGEGLRILLLGDETVLKSSCSRSDRSISLPRGQGGEQVVSSWPPALREIVSGGVAAGAEAAEGQEALTGWRLSAAGGGGEPASTSRGSKASAGPSPTGDREGTLCLHYFLHVQGEGSSV